MKIRPMVWLLLPAGLLTVLLAIVAGRALTAKVRPLPPTGSSLQSPAPLPVAPRPLWESIAVKDLEEALEDREDPEDIFRFLRRREERQAAPSARSSFDKLRMTGTPGILPTPGLSPSPLPGPSPVRGELVEPRTEHREPTIREVHLAAIKYAEVRPEKIQRWRTLSQVRNFVPKFTLGLKRGSDTTIGSSSSGGKTYFTVGPQDESFGVDFGFTWDLASLVWDSAQTAIDVRSRFMVQLRQDILEETTRIYFERQRLMAEFEAAPASDPTLRRERSLRLEELTAQLDALTGGLYSENP